MLKKVRTTSADFTGREEVVVVPLFDEKLSGPVRKLDTLCRSALSHHLSAGHFKAKAGETSLLALDHPGAPSHLLLLGMGEREKADASTMAAAGGEASRLLTKRRMRSCHLLVGHWGAKPKAADFLHSFLKGFDLAQYRFPPGRGEEKEGVDELVVHTSARLKDLAKVASFARLVVEHTCLVRDMVNTPANELTPAGMARKGRELARRYGFRCRVMGPRELKMKKMGALTAVGGGSSNQPRLLVLRHRRSMRGFRLCLVGKGVTFDSGGISIKPWERMEEMKGDMAGGALVLSLVAAAARMGLNTEVVGVIPCVENMPSGRALRPGDVVKTYSGKTIEVLSTDAEGRLILADAIAYARRFDPQLIVDFATLTGACVIALGNRIAGVMGNNQGYIDTLVRLGRQSGERLWQLPLDETFSERVKGDIADYKNYSGRDGSPSLAAALLGEFAGETPWVHVDIAGPFWSTGNRTSYLPKGGTGFGVELGMRFLRELARRR